MTEPLSALVTWHETQVTPAERAATNGHRPQVVWLTGLSGAGKSTLANALERALQQRGCHTFLLDGDNVRHGLNRDLDLSRAGRRENLRRIGEVCKLFVDAGLVVITAFVSPYRDDRAQVRARLGDDAFMEVYVQAALATCERRDPKGLYARARSGEITGMTGIDDPYEPPTAAQAVVDTDELGVEAATAALLSALERRGVIPAVGASPQRPAPESQ